MWMLVYRRGDVLDSSLHNAHFGDGGSAMQRLQLLRTEGFEGCGLYCEGRLVLDERQLRDLGRTPIPDRYRH